MEAADVAADPLVRSDCGGVGHQAAQMRKSDEYAADHGRHGLIHADALGKERTDDQNRSKSSGHKKARRARAMTSERDRPRRRHRKNGEDPMHPFRFGNNRQHGQGNRKDWKSQTVRDAQQA